MVIHFHIHYKTAFREYVCLEYNDQKNTKKIVQLQTYDGENWILSLEVKSQDYLNYKYIRQNDDKSSMPEWGPDRFIYLENVVNEYVYVNDYWRSRSNENNAFLTSAFTKAIFRRTSSSKKSKKKKSKNANYITFNLMASAIPPHLKFGIVGNTDSLGNWLVPQPLDDSNFPTWSIHIETQKYDIKLRYKYVIFDPKNSEILEWEIGENREFNRFLPELSDYNCIVNDQDFRFGKPWRGAGVAIPVFSLRSQNGLGIGEFSDLKPLVDWSSEVGMKIIQVLPVNDTIATKTWTDSYPYAAVSVFALHPLYINIGEIAAFADPKIQTQLELDIKQLNILPQIDFEAVLEKKFYYFRILFNQEMEGFQADKTAQKYINDNADWLNPYAAFCVLRDKYNTCVYTNWEDYQHYDSEVVAKLCNKKSSVYKEILFYYFIQYHAHKQLTEARDYARSKHIALKGDLPIGIYRYSCDAWMNPHLYHMDEQAGAPPDDYAEMGQNWGFPTYNWEEMSKDGFTWWKARMQKLNEYFDAMRIDHILGFFRIWQIPTNQIAGTLGLFNPRLPFTIEELKQYGIHGKIERFTKPFITSDLIFHHFANHQDVVETFFDAGEDSMYYFKSQFGNQLALQNEIDKNQTYKPFEKVLLQLMSEVLLIEESGSEGTLFNPRITVSTTFSFKCLDQQNKQAVQNLYNDYFFNRHDQYWKNQALWKLPALLDASDMLICGEDLGMIPKSVPSVMKDLNIIALEIQRMPKGDATFGQVQEYPYFSVCSPSCHDMSTIRGWWEGNHILAKDYYYNYMFGYGLTPMECEPRIVQFMVQDHLASKSILAIFPIQDLIGIDKNLRNKDASAEQINEPSNPKHYWRFRFHLNVEDLLAQREFNRGLKKMVTEHRQ